MTSAREDEFPPAFFRSPSEERVIGQELKGLAHAQDVFTRFLRVLGSDEVKEPFEIS